MFKLIIFFTIFFPSISFAYLGPGMGGGIIAATLGIVIALFAAIFGIIWLPFRRFLRNRKKKKIKKED